MANNLIQIKRSLNTATPTSLANGEFAYTANGDVLFIGSNSAVVAIAGKRNPGTLTANQALVANSTSGIDKVIVANAVITSLYANGSHGTAGQVLVSNGSTIYWGTGTSGSNTQVQFNDSGVANGSSAFTFNKSTSTLTATNISGNGASITSVDAATVGGNTASTLRTYTDNVAGNAYSNAVSAATALAGNAYSNAVAYAASNTYVNSTFATNTYVNSTFSTNTYVNSTFSTNTYVNSTFAPLSGATFTGAVSVTDLTVSGNLAINGTLTTIDTDNVVVEDSLIKLARNNGAGDSLDIGFYGMFDTGGTDKYAGLFRDATDGKFKLFTDLQSDPTTTVNTSGTGYSVATLLAAVDSYGFVSNSTVTNITANGSFSVAIVANTLTLSTPLAATSGGTGYASYTAGDILTAANGTNFSKLALGTSGYVLQSNGTALVYDTLDGGTF